MVDPAEKLPFIETPIPTNERVLTEVDHLNKHRLPDGSYPNQVLNDVLTNLTTAVQEAAMPFAVTTVEHEYAKLDEREKGTFMWLGKTAVDAAMTGYRFHNHQSARERVDVEVDEARHAEEELRPGVMKIFISPKMSEKDAPKHIAKQEHLADDDAVRASWLETDENGKIQKKVLQSLLVSDVPLEAWVDMLSDENNPFGKAIEVEDKDSALSVMKVHRELELPMGELAEGPVSIVEAVIPYIKDELAQKKVERQLKLFRGDQEDLRKKAVNIAERWLKFEGNLAESLNDGRANFEIKRFIIGLQEHWGEEDLEVINRHQTPGGEFHMSRELAAIVEKAKQNTLWVSAAVVTENESVIHQMDEDVIERVRTNELLIQQAWQAGHDVRLLEAQNNQMVADQNVKVGGGCSGTNEARFRSSQEAGQMPQELQNQANNDAKESDNESRQTWKWKSGVCIVNNCPTRPGKTVVGPCSVCKHCQAEFDAGRDPTKQKTAKVIEIAEPKIRTPELKAA